MTPTISEQLVAGLSDRYRIERELGAGGMATVYLAEDLKHGRKVAIKVVRAELSAALGEERFLREITTTAGLRHPNILPLYDSGAAAGALYYVMPYVEGETVEARLRREARLPLHDALRIARDVADALGYAHAHGVVHRDIKPANILLESGHAVVADFGIASAVQVAGGVKLTQTGMAVGTPAYMSPEQAAGGHQLDGRSDLYSLGCVLYEMLTGIPPFMGPTAAAVVGQHLSAPIPDVAVHSTGVPATIAAIVTRLLAKSPDDRFQDATKLVAALDASLTPTGTAAMRTLAPARSARRLAAGALTLALVLAAWIAIRDFRERIDATPMVALRQVTTSIEVEEYPALSPNGVHLAFSRDLGGIRQLFVLDLATGQETRITRDSSDAIQAVWSPDGGALLFVRARAPGVRLEPRDVFGEFSGGDVWRRAVATGDERLVVEDGYNPSVAADGRIAFDADRGGVRRIWTTDGAGRGAEQLSTDSSESASHVGPHWSPDGRRIVFQRIERTRFDLGVVDLPTHTTRRVTNDGYAEVGPEWDWSGRALWYTSNRAGGYNIWWLPLTRTSAPAGPPVQVTTGAGEDVELSAASDSGRMAFSILHLNADLWRLPVDPRTGRPTGLPEPVVASTREDSRGAWSPDGKAIAFNSDRSAEMNIWIHSLADTSDRQLTFGPGGDYQPRWSPDGRRIYFFSARAGNADIWAVEVGSGVLTQLTSSPWLDINPSVSPDGSAIAFHSDRSGRLELWVMGRDGADQHQLTQRGAGVAHFLPWTPDGRAILLREGDQAGTPAVLAVLDGWLTPVPVRGGSHSSFNPAGDLIADVTRHQQIWITPLQGEPYKAFEFSDPNIRIDYPIWSPDGKWILFDRTKPEGGDIWLMERRP